jgi:hypothetical protein
MFWLTLHKFKRRLLVASARMIEAVIVVAIIVAGGLGSSWYMVEAGSQLTTARLGPWLTWTAAARPDADPYTRAHFVNAGTLPVSAQVQRAFVARTDSSGERLHSSCDYAVEGRVPKSEWWSIAVFDERGKLIANAADRYAFTGQTMALSQVDTFTITLAREARSGNWLPTGGAGRLALVLNFADTQAPDAAPRLDANMMPVIRKLKCR